MKIFSLTTSNLVLILGSSSIDSHMEILFLFFIYLFFFPLTFRSIAYFLSLYFSLK